VIQHINCTLIRNSLARQPVRDGSALSAIVCYLVFVYWRMVYSCLFIQVTCYAYA